MKNRKWVTYILAILLTLIALAVVGVAGFRVGMMQSADFPRMGIGERPAFNQDVSKNANPNGDATEKDNFGSNPRGNDFKQHGFDRGHRGMSIFGGLFGLIHLALLALLLWFGYKLVLKSGWRLVRVQNNAAAVSETVSTEAEEKKESE